MTHTLPVLLGWSSAPHAERPPRQRLRSNAVLFTDALAAQTVMGFKTGEKTTGMAKQCFYSALGSAYTETVSSVALCPLSIKVNPGGL